jgi:hypothetical protein
MELAGEQAAKVAGVMLQKILKKQITDEQKELIRRSVLECAREDNPVRSLLGNNI